VPGTVFATSDGAPPNGANPCGSGLLGPTYNADASARGVELDVRALLRPGWTAQLGVSYADAHFDDAPIPCNDFNGDGQADSSGIPAVQAGRYFSRCVSDASLGGLPKWQVSLNSDYNFPLGPKADGYVRGLVNYKPAATDPNSGLETPETFQADVFAGLRLRHVGASIELFARNLFDEQTRLPSAGEIYSLFGAPTGYSQATLRRPREVGVVARLDF
jgi:iron complex outermembrane receptor protein